VCVGPPLRKNLRELLQTEDKELIEQGVTLYREHYQRSGLFESTLYAGIEELLEALHARRVRLFITTSKPHLFAEALVRHLSLERYFERTYSTELEGEPMTKSDLVRRALSENGLLLGESAIIGDRHHDIDAGREVGIKTVAVQWGYGTVEELTAAGPDYLLHSPSEVLDLTPVLTT
jgi:phosphoglycolate phosphatase